MVSHSNTFTDELHVLMSPNKDKTVCGSSMFVMAVEMITWLPFNRIESLLPGIELELAVPQFLCSRLA